MLYSLKFKERKQTNEEPSSPCQDANNAIALSSTSFSSSGCRQRESGSPLAVRRPPSTLCPRWESPNHGVVSENRHSWSGSGARRGYGRQCRGKRWRAPLSMSALNFDAVGLEESRRSVVVVPRESGEELECTRATQSASKQSTIAASLPRSRPLSLAAKRTR